MDHDHFQHSNNVYEGYEEVYDINDVDDARVATVILHLAYASPSLTPRSFSQPPLADVFGDVDVVDVSADGMLTPVTPMPLRTSNYIFNDSLLAEGTM